MSTDSVWVKIAPCVPAFDGDLSEFFTSSAVTIRKWRWVASWSEKAVLAAQQSRDTLPPRQGRRHTRTMKKLTLIALLALHLTGCENARSIMQMDSNSGSPFLGLQLAVDAEDVPPAEVAALPPTAASPAAVSPTAISPAALAPAALSPAALAPTANGQHWLHSAQATGEADFVLTSQSRVSSGNLKYSLPKVDLARDTAAAAEVDEIRARL